MVTTEDSNDEFGEAEVVVPRSSRFLTPKLLMKMARCQTRATMMR